jgi:site-specific DNA recombinase
MEFYDPSVHFHYGVSRIEMAMSAHLSVIPNTGHYHVRPRCECLSPPCARFADAATTKPPAFDVILVHSFSRFFRDQFQLEFYVRRLAKNGVRLVSITQELGDDPMSNMIRQIMALFDEYQSKENAKHALRAMKENARQGFWNGALPPIGYRIVEAAEQHGHRTKKTLEIDPIQAETVRLIFRLAREGNGSSGPMGVKSIAKHLNEAGIRTRDGGRWGVGSVHKVLTRTTYIGRHRFNTKYWKTRERKPEAEVVEMVVPPIIDVAEFEAVQIPLKSCPVLYRTGALGEIRTPDPQIRSLVLYPAELRARAAHNNVSAANVTAAARPHGR